MTVVKIKKQKAQKIMSKNENLNFKIINKNCLEATKFDNKIYYLKKRN